MLPSWLGKRDRELLKQRVEIPVADSIHTAPGYRLLGEDFYTCVPQVHCLPDPATLRRIHEFDPGLIPMWRKQRYLPPGSDVPFVVTHFALGRHLTEPKAGVHRMYVEMPEGAKHPRPNLLVAILEREDETVMYEGGPGAFERFGPWLYHDLRSRFFAGDKAARKIGRDRQVRERAAKDAHDERTRREGEERQKRKGRVDVRADRLTRDDWQVYWAALEKRRQRKPFVYLGGS